MDAEPRRALQVTMPARLQPQILALRYPNPDPEFLETGNGLLTRCVGDCVESVPMERGSLDRGPRGWGDER